MQNLMAQFEVTKILCRFLIIRCRLDLLFLFLSITQALLIKLHWHYS